VLFRSGTAKIRAPVRQEPTGRHYGTNHDYEHTERVDRPANQFHQFVVVVHRAAQRSLNRSYDGSATMGRAIGVTRNSCDQRCCAIGMTSPACHRVPQLSFRPAPRQDVWGAPQRSGRPDCRLGQSAPGEYIWKARKRATETDMAWHPAGPRRNQGHM
jgi:hypothetical protein